MSFRAGDYTFTFEQKGVSVVFRAVTITGRDMTENDAEWIKVYLYDMGKWETVIKTAVNFAIDTGMADIKTEVAKKYELEFDAKKYDIQLLNMRHEVLEGIVGLLTEERRRRSGGEMGQEVRLPLDEIVEQARNIQKWRNLRRTLSLLLPFGVSLQNIERRIDRIQQTLSDAHELLDRRDVRETFRPAPGEPEEDL